MESFQFDGQTDRQYTIHVEEVNEVEAGLVQTLIEIDLQTFAESTFSHYTAAAFLRNGRVFLLKANENIIGTCVTMRCWDRPNEAMILSMGLKPGWRGRGLGQTFLTGVLDRLKQRGMRSVCLFVGADNRRALRLYEELGFERVASHGADPRSADVLVLLRRRLLDTGPVIALNKTS